MIKHIIRNVGEDRIALIGMTIMFALLLAASTGCADVRADELPTATLAVDNGGADPASVDAALKLAGEIGKAFAARDWRALAAALLTGFILLLRSIFKFSQKKTPGMPARLSRLLSWFQTDRGGAVLAIVLGLTSAALPLLAPGATLSAGVLISGLLNASVSVGIFGLVKKLIWPSDTNKCSTCGVDIKDNESRYFDAAGHRFCWMCSPKPELKPENIVKGTGTKQLEVIG